MFLRLYDVELLKIGGFFTAFRWRFKLHIDASRFAGMRTMYGKDLSVERNKVSGIKCYRFAAKSSTSLLYKKWPGKPTL